jgi:hypothetical protein
MRIPRDRRGPSLDVCFSRRALARGRRAWLVLAAGSSGGGCSPATIPSVSPPRPAQRASGTYRLWSPGSIHTRVTRWVVGSTKRYRVGTQPGCARSASRASGSSAASGSWRSEPRTNGPSAASAPRPSPLAERRRGALVAELESAVGHNQPAVWSRVHRSPRSMQSRTRPRCASRRRYGWKSRRMRSRRQNVGPSSG